MNNPSEGTSIEIVNPLNITSLIHRLFMFFILNSCCAIFFSALPNSLLYGKQFSIFDRDFNSAKLLQKSEMRKDIVIELSYKGFS